MILDALVEFCIFLILFDELLFNFRELVYLLLSNDFAHESLFVGNQLLILQVAFMRCKGSYGTILPGEAVLCLCDGPVVVIAVELLLLEEVDFIRGVGLYLIRLGVDCNI